MVEERKGLQVKQWYRNGYSRPNPESRCKQGAPYPDDAPEPNRERKLATSSLRTLVKPRAFPESKAYEKFSLLCSIDRWLWLGPRRNRGQESDLQGTLKFQI